MAYHYSAGVALRALKSPNRPPTFAGLASLIDTKTKLSLKADALLETLSVLALAKTNLTTAIANLTTATGYAATITLLQADVTAIDALVEDIEAAGVTLPEEEE